MIYFVQADRGGPIKIGYSRDDLLTARVGQLQVGQWERLLVTAALPGGSPDDEACLHRIFAPVRIRGEWFAPIDALAQIAGAIPDPEHCFDRYPEAWAATEALDANLDRAYAEGRY